MKVRQLHRPDEEYSQCAYPKEQLREQGWKGYRESRVKYTGKDPSTCMRESQWEVNDVGYCTQHAGMLALEHLAESCNEA